MINFLCPESRLQLSHYLLISPLRTELQSFHKQQARKDSSSRLRPTEPAAVTRLAQLHKQTRRKYAQSQFVFIIETKLNRMATENCLTLLETSGEGQKEHGNHTSPKEGMRL